MVNLLQVVYREFKKIENKENDFKFRKKSFLNDLFFKIKQYDWIWYNLLLIWNVPWN